MKKFLIKRVKNQIHSFNINVSELLLTFDMLRISPQFRGCRLFLTGPTQMWEIIGEDRNPKALQEESKIILEKMLTTQKTIVCISNTFQYDHVQITGRSRRRRSSPTVTFAKKRDFAENSTSKNQTSIISSLKISKKLLAQSAIAVFALGFTDAG